MRCEYTEYFDILNYDNSNCMIAAKLVSMNRRRRRRSTGQGDPDSGRATVDPIALFGSLTFDDAWPKRV